ncbi:MAG: chorismate mutase [Elusimicrobiales bacterium]|nr:chorismate mutase [Elusimicrobiales bacterium]HPO95841.1 chorismate mutase [Elusimicrobiales bacterium]
MDKKFEINKLRKKIDIIDSKISSLLLKRFETAKKIGEIKKKKNMPVKDFKREKEVLNKISSKTETYGKELKEIYKKIIEKTREIQNENIF